MNALTCIIKADCNNSLFIVPLIIESGQKNCNRAMRQTCISLLEKVMDNNLSEAILNEVLQMSGSYIKECVSDSCNIVRETSRNLIEHLRSDYKSRIDLFVESENIKTPVVKKAASVVNQQLKNPISKSKPMQVAKKGKPSLGKAQRIKIIP